MQGQPAECYITLSALGCDAYRICFVSYNVVQCVLETFSLEQRLFQTLVPSTRQGTK